MKIALCLNGIVGNKKTKSGSSSDSVDVLNLGHEKYKKNLLEDNDVDVYIHSWSKPLEEQIVDLYKPVKHIVEKQEIFEIPEYVKGDSPKQPNRKQNHYSRWRSTEKVLSLIENPSDYDFILVSRFDLSLEKQFDFNMLSKEFVYCSNWYGIRYDNVYDIFQDGRGLFYNLENKIDKKGIIKFGRGYPYDSEGILDLWFLGSPKKIMFFKNLFKQLNSYLIPGNCPQAPLVSNHKLALYHIIQNGEINNLKFITDPVSDHCLIRNKYFNSKE